MKCSTKGPATSGAALQSPSAWRTVALALATLTLGGCASTGRESKDLSALITARPASILVLPPVNESPEVLAVPGVFSQLTMPLAESGYYVFPITLVDETLKANGVQTPAESHRVEYSKLRDIFGADAALYVSIKQYGSIYRVVSSDAVVVMHGEIKDLRTGETIWRGKASASSAEQQGQTQGGLAGLLIRAVVEQIIGAVSDRSFPVAGVASHRLLKAGTPEGVAPGPRARAPVEAR